MGIAAHDSESAMQNFVSARGVDGFPQINDGAGTLWARYGVSYQPAFVFISADGTQTTFGALGQQAIADRIAELF